MKKDKTIFYSVYAFIIIILILFLMITFGTAYYAETTGEELYTTIIILSATALLVVAAILALKIESLIGKHVCPKCHHKFQPEFKKIILAPHIGFTRYLKCPKCNEKNWCKKEIEK